MTATRWCAALAPSRAPGKGVLARGRQSQRAHDPKCGYHDVRVSTFPLRIGPTLSARLSSDPRRAGRKALWEDTNQNLRADTFAEQLEADILLN